MTISHEASKPLTIRDLHMPAAYNLAHIYCLTRSPKLSSRLHFTRATHTSTTMRLREPTLRSHVKLHALRPCHSYKGQACEPWKGKCDPCLYCLLPVVPASSTNQVTRRLQWARSPALTLAGQATMPASCHTTYNEFPAMRKTAERICKRGFLWPTGLAREVENGAWPHTRTRPASCYSCASWILLFAVFLPSSACVPCI